MSILDPLGIFDGGGSSTSVSSTVNLAIQGLDKIGITESIDLQPVTLNENIDLQPVTLNENIDLQPVAVDTCQTLRLAPLPETKVCNPYHHHVALSMFGVEWMAMTFRGESEQEVRSPRGTERTRYPDRGQGTAPTVLGEVRGIRVRVLDSDDD